MKDEASVDPRDLEALIREMRPERLPGSFVFVGLGALDAPAGAVLASVVEPEGPSAVMRREEADSLGLEYGFVAGWITLRVHSALDEVGLTAAVSTCLAELGISCNMIAGLNHDHLLVPIDDTDRAIEALEALSQAARPG